MYFELIFFNYENSAEEGKLAYIKGWLSEKEKEDFDTVIAYKNRLLSSWKESYKKRKLSKKRVDLSEEKRELIRLETVDSIVAWRLQKLRDDPQLVWMQQENKIQALELKNEELRRQLMKLKRELEESKNRETDWKLKGSQLELKTIRLEQELRNLEPEEYADMKARQSEREKRLKEEIRRLRPSK